MKPRLHILDDRLLAAVDSAWNAAAGRAGKHLACRLGCTECCHGPFPIDALDADRLRRGLAALAGTDPALHRAVRDRAQQTWATLADDFPGDVPTGRLDDDSPALESFLTRHAGLPCPALDPATGGCDLYASRPLACRTFGPPVDLAGTWLEPCRLCFVAADPAQVEACRMVPDLTLEAPAFAELERSGDDPKAETLIAFVLAS